MAIASTKLSVLALYYRIFALRKFRLIVMGTACFVTAWIVVMEVVLGLGCRPIRAWWGEAEGVCVDKMKFTYFTNVTNLVTDLWIFSIPLPIILRLQATKDRRIGLCFLFSIGLGTCAISAARLSFVFGVSSPDMTCKPYSPFSLFTFVFSFLIHESLLHRQLTQYDAGYVASLGILSAWEPCGGILCANLPLVYRSLVEMFRKVRASVRGSQTRQSLNANTANTHRYANKAGMYHDWTRLNNSGGIAGQGNHTITEVSASKSQSISTEMDTLDQGGIIVQRDFMQDSHHELDMRDDEESSLKEYK